MQRKSNTPSQLSQPQKQRKRLSPIEKSKREKENKRRKACRKAILARIYASPAGINDLDALGFEAQEINRELTRLLHRGQVIWRGGSTYHRPSLAEVLR